MNPFPSQIHYDNAGMIGGRRNIITTMPFRCVTSLGIIVVPAGTLCDGASIPRCAWSIVGHPFDEYLEDSVLHDYLYSEANDDFTRDEADFIFKETMWNRQIARWKIIAMYSAVRLFGRCAFRGGPP